MAMMAHWFTCMNLWPFLSSCHWSLGLYPLLREQKFPFLENLLKNNYVLLIMWLSASLINVWSWNIFVATLSAFHFCINHGLFALIICFVHTAISNLRRLDMSWDMSTLTALITMVSWNNQGFEWADCWCMCNIDMTSPPSPTNK